MQKISSYLYPNRVELLADLAGFSVEFTNVYQRTIKIYNSIDNTIEFDIKNADQKRLDLTALSTIKMHIMDATSKALTNSPYTVVATTIKGIAKVIIPRADLTHLSDQCLQYSVVAKKGAEDVILYADSAFGAFGKIELINNAIPWTERPTEIYNSFVGEIDIFGKVINHTSAIRSTFYEAEETLELMFTIEMSGFIGTIWLMGTHQSTIAVESFKHSARLRTATFTAANSTPLIWSNVEVSTFKYFRVYYQGDNPLTPTGSVNRVLVNS